jgi:hypothetical protein
MLSFEMGVLPSELRKESVTEIKGILFYIQSKNKLATKKK